MARRATCGRRSPPSSRAIIASSCPISAVWGSRRARPAGYDKKTQAGDVAGVLDALGIERADLVTHDIGNMVGFAFAAQHPERVTSFVNMDAPVPGVGPWEDVLKNPLLWHFRFGGPDMERLVAGRERIYLDRFWNEFAADPKKFSEGSRRHYAKLYAKPGAMHAGFAQFAAFDQDAVDNRAFLARGRRLTMPMLAVGGEKSFGAMQAFIMRFAADDVTAPSFPTPVTGSWRSSPRRRSPRFAPSSMPPMETNAYRPENTRDERIRPMAEPRAVIESRFDQMFPTLEPRGDRAAAAGSASGAPIRRAIGWSPRARSARACSSSCPARSRSRSTMRSGVRSRSSPTARARSSAS